MIAKGFLHEIPSNSSLIANKSKTRRGETRCAATYLASSLLAVLAVMAIAVAPALGQDGTPKIRGNFGSAFGFKTVEAKGGDPTVEDIEGAVMSIESNLFIEGSTGTMSYRFRLRFRGREFQNDDGDQNLFGSKVTDSGGNTRTQVNNLQVFRGSGRWHIGETFDITIGKYGGTRQTSATENDPVQLFPYPLFTADGADAGMIDFTFKFAGGIVGAMVYPDTAGNMTTSGVTRFTKLGSGGSDAGNNNLTLNPYFQGKFGGFGIGARVASSTGEETDSAGVVQTFDATGFGVGLEIPLGIGSLKLDFESATSDLDSANPDNFGDSEEEMTGFGALLAIAGLRVGFTAAEQEVGPHEFTQTNISAHYRFATGSTSWVAPEIQMQTKEDSREIADEEQSAVRLLYQIGF